MELLLGVFVMLVLFVFIDRFASSDDAKVWILILLAAFMAALYVLFPNP